MIPDPRIERALAVLADIGSVEYYPHIVQRVAAILREPASPSPTERTCGTCLNHMKERPVIDSHLRRVEYVERHGERNVSCQYDALPKAGCFYLGRDIPDEVFGGPFHCALWESHYAEKPAEVNQIVSALGSHGENGDIAGVRQGPIVATPAEHSAVAGVGFQEPTVAAPRHPPQRPHDAV